MCVIEHLEVLEYSGIFILNPEYRILFWNSLLAVKWADRPEFENADQRSHDLLISSLRHYAVLCSALHCIVTYYAVPWGSWVYLSFP